MILRRGLDIDHLLRAWVVAHRVAALDGVMWMLSVVGRGGIVWLVIAGVLVATRRASVRVLGQLALALLLTAGLVDHAIKPFVARQRPFDAVPAVAVIGGRPDDASFPSGHAATAFAGALILSFAVPHARIVWWTLAAAIAYSRVYLGVHYPLDVVGGGLIGLTSALVVMAATRSRRSPTSETRVY